MTIGEIIFAVLAFATSLSSVIVALVAVHKNGNKDIKEDAIELGTMQSDLGYIKSGVDDLKQNQRRHDEKLDVLSERVTKVEASLTAHIENKSLHSRSVKSSQRNE